MASPILMNNIIGVRSTFKVELLKTDSVALFVKELEPPKITSLASFARLFMYLSKTFELNSDNQS